MADEINWAEVKVGDELWLAEPVGWAVGRGPYYECHPGVVTKRSPTGQISVEVGRRTYRLTKRGKIIGDSVWDRRDFVTPQEGARLNAESRTIRVRKELAELADRFAYAVTDESQDAAAILAEINAAFAKLGEGGA